MYVHTHTHTHMDFLEDSPVFLSWFDSVLHHSVLSCTCSSEKARMGMRPTRSSRWPPQYSITHWVTRWLGLLGIGPIHTHSPCLIINSASSLSPKCCVQTMNNLVVF